MLNLISNFLFSRRAIVVGIVLLSSLILGVLALRVEVVTHLADMMPINHPYIKVHEQYKRSFGGAAIVTIMVEAKKGDVFQLSILKKVQGITTDLQKIDAVNQYQIVSLASKKLKNIHASSDGIEALPLMWPDVPKTAEEIALLKASVVSNPTVYGSYVSRDLKGALITVDFIERLLDPKQAYKQINEIVKKYEGDDVRISIIGEPFLSGIVSEYLPETMKIALVIILVMAVILFIATRTLRGTVLPLISAVLSAAISIGILRLVGLNFDPLIMVIVFLISARAISHSVQFCTAFDDERELGAKTAYEAAKLTFIKLFRPSVLGLVVDIGGILVITITPIPILQKAAIIGAIWLTSLLVTAVVFVPLALSWVKKPHGHYSHHLDIEPLLMTICKFFARISTRRTSAILVLVGTALILGFAAEEASKVKVGDANPGSPILWPNSSYNDDWRTINNRFKGSDRMFVVVHGAQPDTLKRPDVLNSIDNFQRFIEGQPQIGGTVSLLNLIEPVNMMLHEGNPRYAEPGTDASVNAELLYMATTGAEPGDMDRFTDAKYQAGSIMIFFKDHQGDTLRTAIARIKEYISAHSLPGVEFQLAGGVVGVIAAVNEVIFADQIKSIALAILVLFVICAITYKSMGAGLFFLPLILLSNVLTFAFMHWQNIGMNINTLPIAALGIGLGVDYAFYIVDRIKERFEETSNLVDSVSFGLMTAGRGVLITGITMVFSVLLWYPLSSLRFQAEMGLLIALWMAISALASMLVIPSMIFLFKPKFVVGGKVDANKDVDYGVNQHQLNQPVGVDA